MSNDVAFPFMQTLCAEGAIVVLRGVLHNPSRRLRYCAPRSLLGAARIDEPTQRDQADPTTALGELLQVVPGYRLRELIGQGGMGAVYAAQRADGAYEERVAIKIIGQHLSSSPEALARFRSERQILAKLRHPSIAQIHDGGTTIDGRPYLVMELVDGVPLDQAARSLNLPAKLRLLIGVAEAVHVAHQHLVVHRDLKPNNVLVDRRGDVRLLDFGIAKLLSSSADLSDPVTREVTPMTAAYASPEQRRGEAINTSSDIYSLGVLAYELLTGTKPFYGGPMQQSEQAQTPQLPSARVRDLIEPEGIAPAQLRGDLDAIVLKAMRFAPADRYPSAQAMADDLRRTLVGQPVVARLPTRRYLVWCFLQRHRAWVATAVAVSIALMSATWISVAQRAAAQRAEQRSATTLQLLVDLLSEADPSHTPGAAVTVREAIDSADARLADVGDPAVRAPLLLALAEVSTGLGEYSRARDRYAALLADDPNSSRALAGWIQAQIKLAEAEPAMAAANTLLDDPNAPLSARLAVIDALALYQRDQGQFEAGAALVTRGFAALDAGKLDQAEDAKQRAKLWLRRGQIATRQRDFASATEAYQQALRLRTDQYGENHFAVAEVYTAMAELQWMQEQRTQALQTAQRALTLHQQALNPGHPAIGRAWITVGVMQKTLKQFAAARQSYENALAILQTRLGDDHPWTLLTLNNLGNLALHDRDFARAKTLHAQVLSQRRLVLPARHTDLSQSLSNLGLAEWELGDLAAAGESFAQAYEATPLDDHSERAWLLHSRARTLLALGQPAAAQRLLAQAAEHAEQLTESQRMALSLAEQLCAQALGQPVDPAALDAIAAWRAAQPPDAWYAWVKPETIAGLRAVATSK